MAIKRDKQYHATHIKTKETALLLLSTDKKEVFVQFDRFSHKQSHGWHSYPRKEWRIDKP